MSDTYEEECENDFQLRDFFGKLGAKVDCAIGTCRDELTGFFSGLGTAVDIAKRTQEELDRIAATQFSVFSYFRPVETNLSRIFVDLLRPSGSHGQGDLFLRLFLDGLKDTDGLSKGMISSLSSHNLRECKVHREFPTQAYRDKAPGRIDIVLKMPDNVWIGIENKPWAEDQDQQIKFYLEDLRERGTGLMLYLSKDGNNPAEWPNLDDEARDCCLTVPYRRGNNGRPSLEHWIEKCRERCEAEVVRWFLKDLLHFIRREFVFRAHDVSEAEEVGS